MRIGTPGAAYGPGFSVRRPVLGQGMPYGPRTLGSSTGANQGGQARPMPYRPIRPPAPDLTGVTMREMQRRMQAIRQGRETNFGPSQPVPSSALMLARVAAMARQFQAPLMEM